MQVIYLSVQLNQYIMNVSFAPCRNQQLHPYVNNFWQMEGRPGYGTETILPKGIVELIFSFDEPVVYLSDRSGISTPRCFISGLSSMPVRLQSPACQSFFGIELHPVTVKLLLGAPSGLFLDSIVELELLNKYFGELWHHLAETSSFAERVQLAEQWMLKRIKPVDERELAIAGFLKDQTEVVSVTALASQFCYSSRQLNRKMKEAYGLAAESLFRYKRYLRALQQIHRSNETMTRIAYGAGYFDQAHFKREFKEFTGLTPGEYSRQKTHLPAHLYQ